MQNSENTKCKHKNKAIQTWTVIGVKRSDNEITIRIVNHQRLTDLNTYEHRFIKLQKQFEQQSDQKMRVVSEN